MSFKSIAYLALASGLASVVNAAAPTSGTGQTTRYWDCCKPSCAWKANTGAVSGAVNQCSATGTKLTQGDDMQKSGCDGGDAYMCNDQTPWAVSDSLAYGFAAGTMGGASTDDCCACYQLTFTSTSLQTAGKKMVVQLTNTGSDLSSTQFDLAMPGGGQGIFSGCSTQYPGATQGQQYGGISSASQCSSWGTLSTGCDFRFDWFEGADNPSVSYERVACPAAITAKSGCKRDDDAGLPAAPSGTGAAPAPSSAAPTSSAAPASSSSTYQAPAPTTSAAPAPSSSEAPASSSYQAPSSSTYQAPAPSSYPAQSSAASSSAAPVPSSATSAAPSSYAPTSSYAASSFTTSAAPVTTSASSAYPVSSGTTSPSSSIAPVDSCPVQYVYEYDL